MPLIDSDTWDSRFISLNQLQFHPANPRLPELKDRASEREIIHELCARGKVDLLAKSIAEKGYFRQDRLIVLKEGTKHTVYEGNRRLCALKILAKPDLAPDSMQRAIKRLAEKAKLPKRIAVEVVPAKFDAEVVMYAKHAGQLFTVDWKPVQQATFIAAKLESGESVESLCQDYGLTRDEVIHSRASVDLYRISRLAELTPEARKLVDDPEQFPHSVVFERIIRPKKSRELLGAEISEKGLTINADKKEFLPKLARILDDAAHNRIDTRSLNSEKDQVEYARKIGMRVGSGKFTADDLEREQKSESKLAESKSTAPAAKALRSNRPTGRLFPRDLVSMHAHEKIHRLIDEGKRLEISHAPHACALLLRTLLEVSLVVRLKAQNLWGEVRKLENTNIHGPTLAIMLDYVNTNRGKFPFDPAACHALSGFVSKKVKQSKFELDRIAHLSEAIAHTENVTELREQAFPILREMLRLPV